MKLTREDRERIKAEIDKLARTAQKVEVRIFGVPDDDTRKSEARRESQRKYDTKRRKKKREARQREARQNAAKQA